MKTKQTQRRYYVWGDGAIWKIPAKLVHSDLTAHEAWDGGKMLAATSDWDGFFAANNLPKGIYQTGGGALDSLAPGVYVTHYDDVEGAMAYRRTTREPGSQQ